MILYHKMLLENAQKVEHGEDPMGVIRDAAENEPWIKIPREDHTLKAFRIKREHEARSHLQDTLEQEKETVELAGATT